MKLDDLPDDIIRAIGHHVKTQWIYNAHRLERNERLTVGKDLISLSRCSKVIRYALLPLLFRFIDISFGNFGGDEHDAEKYSRKLARQLVVLAASPCILLNVEHVCLGIFMVDTIKIISKCISISRNLETFSYAGLLPVPTVIAKELCALPKLKGLLLYEFGVESLPSFSTLENLQYLFVQADVPMILDYQTLKYAPITVATQRRLEGGRRKVGEISRPTIEEQCHALAYALVPILTKSRSSLKSFTVENTPSRSTSSGVDWIKELNSTMALKRELLILPALEYLRVGGNLATPALARLLSNAVDLKMMCVGGSELVLPQIDYPHLKIFHYIFDDLVKVAFIVNQWTKRARNIEDFELNGLLPPEIKAIFNKDFDGTRIKSLIIFTVYVGLGLSGGVNRSALHAIFSCCPNLEIFSLKAQFWLMEVSEIKDLSLQLPNLRKITFDHRFTSPRLPHEMNVVDGRTIRWAQTDGGQLFKLMGPGKLFEKEMIRRIHQDIKACTPRYTKIMLDWAKDSENLVEIAWLATPECKWYFEFTRTGGVVKLDKHYTEVELDSIDELLGIEGV